jgi:hypothetical protein
MLSNKDSMVRTMVLIFTAVLQTLITLTIVSNFGWMNTLSIIFYLITAIIYYVVYLICKN